MSTVLLVMLLAALIGIGWFVWPSIVDEVEQARRLRRIDRLRRRTLLELDYLAERAARTRVHQDSRRLDEIVHDLDL